MTSTPPDPPPAARSLRVAVTGSSGLIGSALTRSLRADGHQVHPVVRREPRPGSGEIGWDPGTGRIDAADFAGLDAVVHLAGENVGERWSPAKKRRIRESRVNGTSLLAGALASLSTPPDVLVSGSAIGYYGDRGDEVLREDSEPGDDFLARVGQEWEASTEPAARAGIRVVLPRTGVVLTSEGGALERMLPPFRLGAGGKLGDGDQWMSWISLPDMVRVLRFAIDTPELSGPVIAAAPHPATNRELTRALGQALHRPALMTVPAVALRLVYGEMADATLLASQRAVPARLEEAGFRFLHPRLDQALRAVLDAS